MMSASLIVPFKPLLAKERGDVATELVVANVKHGKGWGADAESGRSPFRWSKLTSRTTMLPEDISSAGRPPESELYNKLRHNNLVSSPSDGDAFPHAAVHAILPQHGDATVLRQPSKEPERALLLLDTSHGRGGHGEQQHQQQCSSSEASERHPRSASPRRTWCHLHDLFDHCSVWS